MGTVCLVMPCLFLSPYHHASTDQVYRLSIGAACGLSWPPHKIIIQVLDDSTDPVVKDCDFVAIFDADFQPEADFLWRTIPFLLSNRELALVQARWRFGKHEELCTLVTFFFYCVVIPMCVLAPGVRLPKLVAVYIPATITILNAICTPRSFHLIIFWILFENVMSLHRSKAAIIGLLEAERANEWVVTEKLGNALKHGKIASKPTKNKNKSKLRDK